jgi:hypothetical protein
MSSAPLAPWDVAAEVRTVADAVRIGRDSAQQMIATAALFAFGQRAHTAEMDLSVEIHLFTVETVSELDTAEVPRAVEHTEASVSKKKE